MRRTLGKSTARERNLCRALPDSEHHVVYLCDCAVKPLDLYRMLAAELGLRPGPRARIVADIKQALVYSQGSDPSKPYRTSRPGYGDHELYIVNAEEQIPIYP